MYLLRSDTRMAPIAVTLIGECAFEEWLRVDRPDYLQVFDVLRIDKECVHVVAFENDRVIVQRAVGGTRISPHPLGTIAAILGPAFPERITFAAPPLRARRVV